MAEKETIRPIYCELQGYLSEAPADGGVSLDMLEQVNQAIENLNRVTGDDYTRFNMVSEVEPDESPMYAALGADLYRSKLNGLIMSLHGRYFSDEVPPFSGTPTTIVSQSQQQNQELRVQMVLEVQDIINEKLSKLDESSKKEKGFLEKVKGGLQSIRSVAQLIWLLLSTAKDYGLSIDELKKIFQQ